MKQLNDDAQEFVMPTSVGELQDLCTELWYNYFRPEEPLKPGEKKALMEKYNLVAKELNKKVNFNSVIILTESTRWIPKDDIVLPACLTMNRKPKETGKEAKLFIQDKKKEKKETKEAPVKKASSVKLAEKGEAIIPQILAHHKAGLSNKEIIALGFNKSTVYIQVKKYIDGNKK